VVVSGVEPRYGRVVKIEHEHGFTTVYAHNDDNFVDVGDWVVTGQRIGSIGRTGRATSFHLHFEIRREGRVYNPLYMLPLPARVAHVEDSEEEEGDE
jgi:murein DD-endopeptidase MepM/ murein hydrolase activator NlpD